jgi:glycosyltransferase involved in cell wall biosynthesis
MSLVTVLIPTHDHADTLLGAVGSVQAQRHDELEIFVVGDGVPDRTREIVAALEARDPRVRFFDRPKGERHGERHRAEALRHARGRFVCYLSDDDLWLPGHLDTVLPALEENDLVHTMVVVADPEGRLTVGLVDVAAPGYLGRLRANHGGFGPSCAAHTLDAYRRLPDGWRPAPAGINSDAWMWIQFLEQPWLRATSLAKVTVLRFPASGRSAWSPARRLVELDGWWRRIQEPGGIARLHEGVIEALARERIGQLDDVRRRLEEELAELARVRRERDDLARALAARPDGGLRSVARGALQRIGSALRRAPRARS